MVSYHREKDVEVNVRILFINNLTGNQYLEYIVEDNMNSVLYSI